MSSSINSKNRDWDLANQHSVIELNGMYNLKTLNHVFESIKESNLIEKYLDKCKDDFKDEIINDKIHNFWKEFDYSQIKLIDQHNNQEMKQISMKVFHKLNNLFIKIFEWIECPIFELIFQNDYQNLDKFRNLLKIYIKSAFEWKLHISFHHCLFIAYSYGFKLSQHLKNRLLTNKDNNSSLIDQLCELCTSNSLENLNILSNDDSLDSEQNTPRKDQQRQLKCSCSKTMDQFKLMNKNLRELNLLKLIANDAISSTVHSHIEKYIKENCKHNFEVSWLERLESWVEEIVIEWLKIIYGETDQSLMAINSKDRLTHFIYETYGQIRIEQMFDIIVEYPDSEAALKDLKYCIEKCTGYREKIIDNLKESFEIRLLHPGVATNDILQAYIQAIRALRILDNSGVILELVCDSVKKYLISREDTVRCIISALTDENSELIPELTKNTQPVEEGNQSDDEYICEHWQDWEPDPFDAGKLTNSSRSLRTSDIVSILVNIYESKDLFVEEYQRLLAHKFLTSFECNEENERRYLELLTLRFGESDLDACEVMLKDMNSSKKLDNRINQGEIIKYHFDKFPIKCLTVSLEFWPENLDMLTTEEMNKYKYSSDKDDSSKMKLPDIVQKAITSYTKCFETINANRTMYWIYSLGQVELDLELSENKKISFTVSPIQASIIWNFQEKSTWSINELSKKLNVPSTILRRKILFWQNKGILKETKNDVFTLVDDDATSSTNNTSINKMDTDLNDLSCNYEEEMLDIDDDEHDRKRISKFY